MLNNQNLKFIVLKIQNMNPGIKKEVTDMLISCFPDNPSYINSVYTNKDLELCILGYMEDQLISHVGITKRCVIHKDVAYTIGGIGDVGVLEKYRKGGTGLKIMQRANQVLKEEGYDLGLLFCHPDLDSFYTKCGWLKKEHGKIYAVSHGKDEDQRRTFYLPVKIKEANILVWSNEDIHVGIGSW